MPSLLIIIIIVAAFYLFLWLNILFIRTENKIYRYTLNTMKVIILLPFWMLLTISTVNLYLPITFSGKNNDTTIKVANSADKPAKVIFLGRYYGEKNWNIIYPFIASKNKPIFEAGARYCCDSIIVSKAYENIVALNPDNEDGSGLHPGVLLNVADSTSIDLAGAPIPFNFMVETEYELVQSALYLLALFGLWYHVIAYKEQESKGKILAGAIVGTFLCLYIIYNFINALILVS